MGATPRKRKQTSISAPMSVTSLACAIVRPGTLVKPWVTSMFLDPRLAAMIFSEGSRESTGLIWPVVV